MLSRSAALTGVALLFISVAAGCSSFSGSEERGSEGGAPDGGAPDGGTDAVLLDAGDAAPSGVVFTESFEAATGTTCPNWSAVSGATALVDHSTVHGGTSSCQMCFPSLSYVDRTVSVPGGGAYSVLAYVRPEKATTLQLGLYVLNASKMEIPGSAATNIPLDGTRWQLVQASVANAAPEAAAMTIRFIGPSGECLFVDDIALERAP
jgi:hypothetical protein